MNTSHTKKPIKIKGLDNIQIEGKLQELSLKEVSFIQGGLTLAHPEVPPEAPKLPTEIPIRPYYPWSIIPCSRYPYPLGTESKLPWCAVIL